MSISALLLVLFIVGIPIGLMAFTWVLIMGEMEDGQSRKTSDE